MEDPEGATLEAAFADAGLLLVELEKFRAAHHEPADRLRAEALALGARARRQHRAGALGDTAAAVLGAETRALLERLRGTLRAIRQGRDFRAAVAAHRDGDHGALAALLPALFAGLRHVPSPPPLFHGVTWLRRNRPRPAPDVVADVVRARDQGLPADGDAETPGTDPELPAVALATDPPAADPLLLRFAPGTLPGAVFRLEETGVHLVHVPCLRSEFEVIVPETLDPEELGEISLDHPRYRAALLDALAQAGLAPRHV